MYIVDYSILEGIQRNGQGTDEARYVTEPLVLLYVKSSGDLVPIAIQLHQQSSHTNPIWTPNDSKLDWLFAKLWAKTADLQVHQVSNCFVLVCGGVMLLFAYLFIYVCMYVFSYSVIQLFSYSVIQLFSYSVIQLFSYSVIQLFSYSVIQLFSYSVIQLFSYSVIQLFSYSVCYLVCYLVSYLVIKLVS